MSELFTMPPAGRQFARAKSLLKRDETIRALESILAGLREYEPKGMSSKIRFEIEVLLQECVMDLNRQPAVRALFEQLTKSKKASVPYKPGEEKKLEGILGILHKALAENVASKERSAMEAKAHRRDTLYQKGKDFLKAGDGPRGKASLRILAEEYGHEPDILVNAAELLIKAKFLFEAAEMLEQSMEAFPKNSKAYGLASQCYLELREFQKGEHVYLRAIKQFGKHPRTLLNLAKLYQSWNKKEEAFRYAQEALKKDPALEEAREIVDKYA